MVSTALKSGCQEPENRPQRHSPQANSLPETEFWQATSIRFQASDKRLKIIASQTLLGSAC
jgi:hypothetical protein